MSEVDKRVVEMSFENRDFENGVRQSLATLEKIESSLSKMKLSDSFNNQMSQISKAASQVDFSELYKHIDNLKARFSSIRVVAEQVLRNITNGVMNLGSNFISGTIGKVINGGWNRAANIEQARFMLKGLGVDVEEAMKNANDAVDGTAYGLDAAAKAAGQLAASGIELGDEMTSTLQGIAGVAAMTGSDYDSVAHIFEMVAGQGRMMGDTLMMMSTRGLNAAKDLSDYFNGVKDGSVKASEGVEELSQRIDNYWENETKGGQAEALAKGFVDKAGNITEAGIREITSRGIITADAFFEVMKTKYADHAKEANDTYEGAMANVQSALSRIGAEFATPWRESMRQIAVTVIPIIKTIQKVLQPVYDRFQWFMDKYVKQVVTFLQPIEHFFDRLTKYQDAVSKGEDVSNRFLKVQQVLKVITDMIKIPWRILKLIVNQVMVLAKTAGEIFPDLPKFKDFADVIEKIKKSIKHIKLKDAFDGKYISESVKNINEVFKVFINIIDMARIGIKNFAYIISPIFKPVISIFKLIGKNLLDLVALINGGAKKLRELDQSEVGQSLVKNIHDAIDNIMTPITDFIDRMKTIKEIVTDVKNMFSNGFEMESFSNLNVFEKIIGGITSLFTGIREGFKNSGIDSVLNSLKNTFFNLRKIISDSWGKIFSNKNVTTSVDKVSNGFKKILQFGSKIGSVVGNALKKVFDFINNIAKTFDKISKNGFVNSITNFSKKIKDIFGNTALSSKDKFSQLTSFLKELSPAETIILSIGTAITTVKDGFSNLANWFKNLKPNLEIFKSWKDAIERTGKLSFWEKIKELSSKFGPITTAIGLVIDAFRKLVDKFKEFIGYGNNVEVVGDSVKNAMGPWETFLNVMEKVVGKVIEFKDFIASNFSKAFDDVGAKLGDKANTVGGKIAQVISAIFGGIFNIAKEIFNKIVESFQNLGGKVEESANPLKKAGEIFKTIFNGIKNVINDLVESLGIMGGKAGNKGVEIFKGIIDAITKLFMPETLEASSTDSLQYTKHTSVIKKNIGEVSSNISGVAKVAESLKGNEKPLLDGAKVMATLVKAVKIIVGSITILYGLLMLVRTSRLLKDLREFFQTLTTTIQGVGEKIGVSYTSKKAEILESFKNLSTTILAMAASILMISLIPTDKLWQSVAVMGILTAAVVILSKCVNEIEGSSASWSKDKGFKAESNGFTELALFIGSVAIFLLAIINPIKKMIAVLATENDPLGNLPQVLVALGLLYGPLVGLIILMMQLSKVDATNANTGTKKIRALAKALIPIALSLAILTRAIGMVANMVINANVQGEGNEGYKALFIVSAMLSGIMIALGFMIKIATNNYLSSSSSYKKLPLIILSIAGLLLTVSLVMKIISTIDFGTSIAAAAEISGVLLALIPIITIVGRIANNLNQQDFTEFAITMALIMGSLLSVAGSIKLVSSTSIGKSILSVIELIGSLYLIVGSISILKNILNGMSQNELMSMIALIITFTTSIAIIASSIRLVSSSAGSSWDAFKQIITIFMAVVASIAVLGKLIKGVDLESVTLAILGVSGAIGIISASIILLSHSPAAANPAAFIQLIAMFGALAVAIGVLAGMSGTMQLGDDLLIITAAMVSLSAAVILLSIAIKKLAEADSEKAANAFGMLEAMLLTLIGGIIACTVILGVFAPALTLVLTPIAAIIAGIASLVRAFSSVILAIGMTVLAIGLIITAVKSLSEQGPEGLRRFGNAAQNVFLQIVDAIHMAIMQTITNIWESIDTVVGQAYERLPSIISKLTTTIATILNEEAEKIYNGTGLGNAMVNFGNALGYALLKSLADTLQMNPLTSGVGDWIEKSLVTETDAREAGKRQVEEYYAGIDEEQAKHQQENGGMLGDTSNGLGLDNAGTFFGNMLASSGVTNGIGSMFGITPEASAEEGKENGLAFIDAFAGVTEEKKGDTNGITSVLGSLTSGEEIDTSNINNMFKGIQNGSDESTKTVEKNEKKKITAYEKEANVIKSLHKKNENAEKKFMENSKKYQKEMGISYTSTEKGRREQQQLTANKQKEIMAKYQHNNKQYDKFVKDKIKWEKQYGEEYIKGEKHITKASKQAQDLRKAAAKTTNKLMAKTYKQAAKEIEKSIKDAQDKANKTARDTEAGKFEIEAINKQIREGKNKIAKESMNAMKEANEKAEKQAKLAKNAGSTFDKSAADSIAKDSGTITTQAEKAMKNAVSGAQVVADNNPVKLKLDIDSSKIDELKEKWRTFQNSTNNSGSNGNDNNPPKPEKKKQLDLHQPFKTSQNIIQGMVDGIQNGSQALNTAGINAAQTIIKAINTTLGIHSPSKVMKKAGKYTAQGLLQGFANSMYSQVTSRLVKRPVSAFISSINTYLVDGIKHGITAFSHNPISFNNLFQAIRLGIEGAMVTANDHGKKKLAYVIGETMSWLSKEYKKAYKKIYEAQYKLYRDQGLSKKEARQRAEEDAIQGATDETTAKAQASAFLWEHSEKYKELQQKIKDNNKEIKHGKKWIKEKTKEYGSLNKLKKKHNKAEKAVKKAEKALEDWDKKHKKKGHKLTKEEKEERKKLKEDLKNAKKEEKTLSERISKWKEFNKKIKQLYKQNGKLNDKVLAGYKNFIKEWRKEVKKALKEQLTENFVQEITESFKVLSVSVPKNVSVLIGSMNKVIDIMQIAGQAASNSISLIQSSMTQFTDILKSAADTGINLFSEVQWDWMNPSEILYNMEQQVMTYDKYITSLAALQGKVSKDLYDTIKNMGYSSEGISYLNAFNAMSAEDIARAEASLTKMQTDEVNKYIDNMNITMDKYRTWQSSIDSKLGIDESWLNANGFSDAFDELIKELKEGGTDTLEQIELIKKMTKEQLTEFLALYKEQQTATNNSYLTSIQANADAYAEWVKNLDKLKTMVSSGQIDKALYNELQALGIDGRDYIKQIINMNDEQLSTLREYFNIQQGYNSHAVLDDMTQSLRNYQDWLDNMAKLRGKVSKEMYQELNNMGYAGAATVANFASMTAQDLAKAEELFAAQQAVNAANYMNDMEAQLVNYQNYVNNLKWLEEQGLSHGLIKELEKSGVQAADQVQALVTLVNQGQKDFINNEYNDSMKMNANNWLNDLEMQMDDYREFYVGLAQLQSGAIKDGAGNSIKINKQLLNELKAMGVEGLDYVRMFLTDSNGETLKAANEAYEKQEQVTKANLIMSMREEQQRVVNFAKNIKKMADKGYDVNFLNDLIGQGYEAVGEQVALYSEMTDQEIAEINTMYSDIDKIAGNGAKNLANAITAAFNEGHDKYDEIMTAYSDSTKTGLDSLVAIFGDYAGIIAEDWGHDGDDAGAAFISSLVGTIIDDATTQSNTDTNIAANSAGTSAGQLAASGFDAGFDMNPSSIKNEIVNTLTNAVYNAKDSINLISGNAGYFFDEGLGKSIYKNRAELVKDKLLEMFDTMIGNQKKHLKERGAEIGKFIDKGIAKGIKDEDNAGNITSAIENLSEAAISALMKVLGINSPSKVFAELGSYSVKGFAKGIVDTIGLARNASEQLGATAFLATENALSGIDEAIQNRSTEMTITPVVNSDTALTGLAAIDSISANSMKAIGTLNLDNINQVSAISDLYSQVGRLAEAVNSINDYTETLGHIDLLVGEYLPRAATDVYLDGAKISQNVNQRLGNEMARRSAGW